MITVDELKRLFKVEEDQQLADIFDRTPGAVSNWRKTSVPASIERRASEIMRERGIVSEPPTLYSSDGEVSQDATKAIDTLLHFDSVTQKMLGRVFDRMKDMTEEEQWNYCADQLAKLQKKGE
jgi:hypothetical protein